MGDRRIAEIKTEEGSLYFYTHWAGHDLYYDALRALDWASPRREQQDYVLKIVIDYLIRESNARDKETGAGISLSLKQIPADDYSYEITGDIWSNEPTVLIDIRPKEWEVYDLLATADRATLGLDSLDKLTESKLLDQAHLQAQVKKFEPPLT